MISGVNACGTDCYRVAVTGRWLIGTADASAPQVMLSAVRCVDPVPALLRDLSRPSWIGEVPGTGWLRPLYFTILITHVSSRRSGVGRPDLRRA